MIGGSYDDGEDVPTPGDGFTDEHGDLLRLVQSIDDPDLRRALWAIIVLTVFGGRIGRAA